MAALTADLPAASRRAAFRGTATPAEMPDLSDVSGGWQQRVGFLYLWVRKSYALLNHVTEVINESNAGVPVKPQPTSRQAFRCMPPDIWQYGRRHAKPERLNGLPAGTRPR
jgi:hypothetical protein